LADILFCAVGLFFNLPVSLLFSAA